MHWFLVFVAFTLVGNGVGYVLIGRDKKAAKGGKRRRPEDTFSLLALLGLWPGMLLSMRVHRHKTRKKAFRRQLFATAFVGTIVWAILGFAAWTAHAPGTP